MTILMDKIPASKGMFDVIDGFDVGTDKIDLDQFFDSLQDEHNTNYDEDERLDMVKIMEAENEETGEAGAALYVETSDGDFYNLAIIQGVNAFDYSAGGSGDLSELLRTDSNNDVDFIG